MVREKQGRKSKGKQKAVQNLLGERAVGERVKSGEIGCAMMRMCSGMDSGMDRKTAADTQHGGVGCTRRALLTRSLSGMSLAAASTLMTPAVAWALQPAQLAQAAKWNREPLNRAQSQAFLQWLVLLIEAQLRRPTPRWQQRDCAGLVRFAAAEALRAHDADWVRANGLRPPFPPEVQLTEKQQNIRHQWRQTGGERSAYASAIDLIQHNSRLVGRDFHAAQTGDLLFYDQGDAQHLMVWLGRRIVYHTGQAAHDMAAGDTGMRAVRLHDMMRWKDTRWRPQPDNPNFAGVYRLYFVQAVV